jgi:phosphonate transport system permease protein
VAAGEFLCVVGPSGQAALRRPLDRWDINIRESTVLGLVGAGGIGFALNGAILGLEWNRVGMILLVILTVVIASEASSASLRARLT